VTRYIEFSVLALALLGEQLKIKIIGPGEDFFSIPQPPVLNERGVLLKWDMAYMIDNKGCSALVAGGRPFIPESFIQSVLINMKIFVRE
jgi:hypothetical protein